jgi:hypothetical protein
MYLAQVILDEWYVYSRGGAQIISDVDVLDGIAARYNLIVLGGPSDNEYTKRRSEAGVSRLVSFLPSGGVVINDRKYEEQGTGAIFLAPSAARTRLSLIVSGVDEIGLRRAVWSIPFRTGLEVPDYLVVGDPYGDPASGWTGSQSHEGGILATGFWNNTWDYDAASGYLK